MRLSRLLLTRRHVAHACSEIAKRPRYKRGQPHFKRPWQSVGFSTRAEWEAAGSPTKDEPPVEPTRRERIESKLKKR